MKRCPICNTPLNSYNPGPNCHAHTPGTITKMPVAVSKCVSRDVHNPERDREPRKYTDDFMDGYFDMIPVGQVQRDGSVGEF